MMMIMTATMIEPILSDFTSIFKGSRQMIFSAVCFRFIVILRANTVLKPWLRLTNTLVNGVRRVLNIFTQMAKSGG